MSAIAARPARLSLTSTPNLVFGLLIFALVAAGIVHSFVIAPRTGAPSLHPLAAFGFAVLAAHFMLRERVHGWASIWTVLHALVLAYSVLDLLETFVPGWPALIRHPILLDAKADIGVQGSFSIETALGLSFLHLAFLVKPLGRTAAVIAFLAAASVAILALLKAAFHITLWGQNFSIFSLGCILTATMALAYRLRDTIPLQPFFTSGRQALVLRALVILALTIPWLGGYLFFRVSNLDFYTHAIAENVFRMMGWVMVLMVMAVGYFMEKSRKHLRRASELDHLRDPRTGALNRAGLFAATDDMTAARGVVLFDLDEFQRHSELLGRRDAKRVLKEVVDAVTDVLEPGEALARWGADEFLVAVEAPEETALSAAAERVRAAVDGIPPRVVSRRTIPVSATFGISMAGPGRDGIEKAIGHAYLAIFETREAQKQASRPPDAMFSLPAAESRG
ncbi:hypothetical protein RGUI_1761 [Rhodovulum sp. P5]|uniref:GGDEF domain-containing protein n=1 Tax=Rhodovulum sp. P5 TaxID=1564506 RepID=UPI0009C1C17D|nr:diguanylate cyclase [Rhodovulum sp. P5]ARE39902.1 hypothetical protein RGUI_1761 [Rhodovulum sp. P5]